MDSSASRFIAALLAQTPGSRILESNPGRTTVSLALLPLKQTVVVLQAADPTQLSAQVKQAVDAATLGVPLHVVVINPGGLDVAPVLEEQVRPALLQVKAMAAVNWVPGQAPVAVRNKLLPQLVAAATLAGSTASLSFEEMKEMSHREADVVLGFQAAVMQRKPVVSWAIAAVCVAIFALQMLWGEGQPVIAAARMGAEIPNRVLAGEWWRLFSVMLLHGNIFHLVMNMLAMLSFGPFLERLMGSSRYLVLYVVAGLGGSLLSLTRGGDTIGVGASGGIWGLMVAGAVVVTWPRGLMPASLALQLRQRAWLPVGINLIYSLQPGIDMLAHVGGGLAGGLLVLWLTRGASGNEPMKPTEASGPMEQRGNKGFSLAAGAVALLLTSSMGIALVQGKPWELSSPWELAPVKLDQTGIALNMPEGLGLAHEAGSLVWHFGELNSTGVEFIVQLTPPFGEEVDLSHPLEELVAELHEAEPGLHYTQKPKITKLPSGREVVFAALAPDNKEDVRFLWQWWAFEDRRWVMVLGNALNTTRHERRAQMEQIADSIASANPSPDAQ